MKHAIKSKDEAKYSGIHFGPGTVCTVRLCFSNRYWSQNGDLHTGKGLIQLPEQLYAT